MMDLTCDTLPLSDLISYARRAGEQKVKKINMRTLTTTEELAEFCQNAATRPYVTVDTEFLRERTYYSIAGTTL